MTLNLPVSAAVLSVKSVFKKDALCIDFMKFENS